MADEITENIFLVNAPAGSGKTTKIRSMVELHLRENPTNNILCITYTNRAAEELGRDIDNTHAFFGTIHSFIDSFIKSFFSHKEVIDLYWEKYQDRIKERIDNVKKDEHIMKGNNHYIEKHKKLDMETVRENIHFISYNEAPFTSLYTGALSHDDLISFTRILIDKFPVIKRKISDKYQLIFIDEYQDTSTDVLHIFYESMKDECGKLYLLGDKMQQIYSNYDGNFEKEFSHLNRSFKLDTNYRATPQIVSILNNIYNDKDYKQVPYKKNLDMDMDYSPEFVIAASPEKSLEKRRIEYPYGLVLCLLNRDKFNRIGAAGLYDTVSNIEKYSLGGKYSVVDVLTTIDEMNPDKLFELLFLFVRLEKLYKAKMYGKILSTIKAKKSILNVPIYTIRKHADKKSVKQKLEIIFKAFDAKDKSIKDFLIVLQQGYFVRSDDENNYLMEILGDKEYESVLAVPVQEIQNLASYLEQPRISTQHGVKGESHNTVFFVMSDSTRKPYVHMTQFLKFWSKYSIDLSGIEEFYYQYKQMINNIESIIGVKPSQMKAADYNKCSAKIYLYIDNFAKKYPKNDYYHGLLKEHFDIYLQRKNCTAVKQCLKENQVYGVLSAYRLFYVGCSRARKNLTIISNSKDIDAFKTDLIKKCKNVGFVIISEE
jgi:DNA helicase II / ATP-dependent DNA helicase PcrA